MPYRFYIDRKTVFECQKKNSTNLENDTLAQFAYARKQLGVDRDGGADKFLDSPRAPKGAESECIHKKKLMSL